MQNTGWRNAGLRFGRSDSDRPVLSIPVSRAEKKVYALYWVAAALSLVVAVLSIVYLPEKVVVISDGPDGGTVIRDKYVLAFFSVFALSMAPVIASLRRYPMHRSTYFVKITSENAEAQYKLARLMSACLIASLAWWIAGTQAVLFGTWLTGREHAAIVNVVVATLFALPVGVMVYGVVASRRLG